jgi:hypothetical protein
MKLTILVVRLSGHLSNYRGKQRTQSVSEGEGNQRHSQWEFSWSSREKQTRRM